MKKTIKAKANRKRKTPASRARKMARARPVPMFYQHPEGQRAAHGDTMGQELASAARGPRAAAGLRRFLEKYEPPDGEYQDGFDGNRIRAAKYELMRLEYIKGNVRAGDMLLAELQDVDDQR